MSHRVLHYVDSQAFGGSEQAALQLMVALDRSRWEPALLHHAHPGIGPLLDGAAEAGIRAIAIPESPTATRVGRILRLSRAIRAESPAVFHAHLPWPLAARHGVLAAWLARVPAIVGTGQLYIRPKHSRRARLHLRPVRRILAVSREVERGYVEEIGIPPHRVTVVPNGIPAPSSPVRRSDPTLRAELLEGRPDYLVLTVARLDEQKGHTDLLAAAALVPEASFVMAGEGPLRGDLERRARELGVADRCVFLGHRRDVAELMAAADLIVLPSHYEGLPVSILEAMVAERPVLATRIGGTDEAVEHGVTGLLVPPGDPAALAAAVRRLRTDPALARRLAAAGRRRVEREFSIEATAQRVMAIYDEVVSRRRSAPETHPAARADAGLDRPEEELNPLLRRVDWRFLVGMPRPRRVLCRASDALTEALESIAAEVVTADPGGGCDLAVAEDPAPGVLGELHAALLPGGVCYTEWRAPRGGEGGVSRALEAAGFTDIALYRPRYGAEGLPIYWVPSEAPGARAYVRSRLRLRGGRARRWLSEIRRWLRGLARGHPGSTICAVARRPGSAPAGGGDSSLWIRAAWSDHGLGPPPERLSTLLVTGGSRSVSKVVILGFAEPEKIPRVAVKAARVDRAARGLRREASVLEGLSRRGAPAGVPDLLFHREARGVPVVGEVALAGRPLQHMLTRSNHRRWAIAVTDWLVALAGEAPRPASTRWKETVVRPSLVRFAEKFGAVADRDLLRRSETILGSMDALPIVPEQRDFGPWNVLVTPSHGLAVLDWESACLEGVPGLDLLYYLAYASFAVDGARDRESRLNSYRRLLEPASSTGAVRRECLDRYAAALDLEPQRLAPLGALVWLVHARSDFDRAAEDSGGAPPARRLARSLFLALWAEEARQFADG